MNELFNCSSNEDIDLFIKKNSYKKIFINDIRNLQGNTPIHTFVLTNKKEVLKKILSDKHFVYDINSINSLGDTPLHLSNNDEISQILLKYNANPFIPNKKKNFSYYKVKNVVDKMFIR